jgi:predicted RNA-binding Zn-ribbon protein involved in translation (DUF1610 family)
MGETEVLEDVGRPIPVAYTCPGCGEDVIVEGETGREVVEDGKCVEMHVDVECPSCGEPFSKKYDFGDEPKADFRELDDDYIIPPLNLPEGLKEQVLEETSIDEVRVGYDLPPRWEPGDALPRYASPGTVEQEVLHDVGRVVPAEVECSCGFNDYVDAETGKEVVDERGCIEMYVCWSCPECGEKFSEVRDLREDPAMDPRRLPGYEEA